MSLEVIILAAGQGTRMKSEFPKVLHPVGGKPMLQHLIDTAQSLNPIAIHVVIGHQAELIEEQLAQDGVNWVLQAEQHGTGHAVMQAMPAVAADSDVLILVGDAPLLRQATLQQLLQLPLPALVTAELTDPRSLGRIVRDEQGTFVGVVEYKDASAEQRTIREINSGVIAATAAQLNAWLPRVGNDNNQNEYYLPDVLPLAIAEGVPVQTALASEIEVLGVNDKAELNRVEREHQQRQAAELMQAGVTLADAARVDVRGDISVGTDVYIDINAVFEGKVTLGNNVSIGPNCVLKNVSLGDGVEVKAFSHLEEVTAQAGCEIGPYARLRPGTELGEGAKIGNFVETKKASIGAGSKANHLAYVGDAEVGSGVNIGAGTITCNYDGAAKHKTKLGDGVFVGSNSTLVAPVEVEEGGYVGAGSTVTKKVEEGELAVSRAKQRNIKGWKRPKK